MPLWTIYHPPSTFTSTSTKAGLAKAITEIYTVAGLPAFYVNVFFQPIEPESCYIGGVARPSPHAKENEPGPDSEKPFIRITIQNIARTMYVNPRSLIDGHVKSVHGRDADKNPEVLIHKLQPDF